MGNHDGLIETLSRSATPVKRPLPTAVRVAVWTALALPCGALMTVGLQSGLTNWSQPGAAWALVALVLSFVLGALGLATAFDLGIPGRKVVGWQGFVPLIVAWLIASAMSIVINPDPIGRWGEGSHCYGFMTLAGAPMIVLAIVALRRTRALAPGKALAVAGLGIAFMTSTLLTLCHPIEGQLADFLMHLAAAGTIVAVIVVFGRRWVAV